MIWIARLLIVRQVAADTRCERPLVFPSGVTGIAIERGMHSSQRKTRKPCVIEVDALPVVDGVALLALGRKSSGHVVRIGRLLERVLMAGVALDRQTLELSNRLAFVTVGTIQARMTADQREAIVVLPCSLVNDVPALHRVTLLAVRAHLPAVDVGVTIGAVRPRIAEHRFGMALRARNSLMQATQRIASVVVIKLRDSADRFPTHRGMAVLAGDRQIAVRTPGNRILRLAAAARRECAGG